MDGGSYSAMHADVCAVAPGVPQTPPGEELRVTLAESFNDIAAAMAIRAVVWLNEPGARYASQFDPNDWTSSHVIVWIGDEPVGTLRLRWFSEFARFERMAIRPEYRSLAVFRRLINYSMQICAAKGYKYVIGMTRDTGLKFWKRYGGRVVGDPLSYNGMCVYPMRYELSSGTHPMLEIGADGAGDPGFEGALSLPEGELVVQ